MFFKDENEYREYIKKNKVNDELDGQQNYFEISRNGEVVLESSKCLNSNIDVSKYTNCIGWILLKDKKTMALLKLPFGDIYRRLSKQQYDISLYNNILLPQIAKELQNNSALYYIAKQQKREQSNYERKYLLTLDFKDKDEKLIYGEDILEKMQYDINELNIEQLLFAIEDYLIEIGINNLEVENIKKNFIKQSMYNRFVKQADENNHNWGILIDEESRKARLSPLYDLDCCCDIGPLKKHRRKDKNGGEVSLESFIKQFENEEWFNIYLQEIIRDFDIDKVIKKAKKATNITIPKEIEDTYRTFFGQRFYELKSAYQKIQEEKQNDNQEIIEK